MHARAVVRALLLAAVVYPAAVLAQVPSQPDPERTAVQQVIVRLGELLQAGDLAAIEPLVRPRLHILTDNATTHGWTEYRDQYLIPELDRIKAGYAHTAVEATVRGAFAYVAFRRVFGEVGSPAAKEGRGTAVLEKMDGRWVIVHLQMAE